jgi:hypothetical protein
MAEYADMINLMTGGAFGALGTGVIVGAIILLLAIYIYSAFALMTIANRRGTPNGWLAFIPIANVYLVTQIGKQSGWWTLGLLAAIIPVLGGLAVLALMIFLYWKLAEACKRPGWWGILLVVPIVNLIMIGILAWGKE